MAKPHRVEPVGKPFSGTQGAINAGERRFLPVERDSQVRDVRDVLTVKEVVDLGRRGGGSARRRRDATHPDSPGPPG
jgi:hypothetical protein